MDKMIKKKQVTAIILFFVTAIYLFAIEDDVKRIKSILNRESAEIEKVVKKEGNKDIYYFEVSDFFRLYFYNKRGNEWKGSDYCSNR